MTSIRVAWGDSGWCIYTGKRQRQLAQHFRQSGDCSIANSALGPDLARGVWRLISGRGGDVGLACSYSEFRHGIAAGTGVRAQHLHIRIWMLTQVGAEEWRLQWLGGL